MNIRNPPRFKYAERDLGKTIRSVTIATVHSKTQPNGSNYGHRGSTLWVDQGLRATFTVVLGGGEVEGSKGSNEVAVTSGISSSQSFHPSGVLYQIGTFWVRG